MWQLRRFDVSSPLPRCCSHLHKILCDHLRRRVLRPGLVKLVILSLLEANIRAALPSSVRKDAGVSFQDDVVPVVTNEQMQDDRNQCQRVKGIIGLVTPPKSFTN